MNEWIRKPLNNFAVFSNGKSRPFNIDFGIIPIYGGNGIFGFTNLSNSDGETIVIGRVGAYCGSVYYDSRNIWVSDNAIICKSRNEVHTKFLYYFLNNLKLNSFAEGSSHPLLTQTLLNSIEVTFPKTYEYQKAIAGVLSTLSLIHI